MELTLHQTLLLNRITQFGAVCTTELTERETLTAQALLRKGLVIHSVGVGETTIGWFSAIRHAQLFEEETENIRIHIRKDQVPNAERIAKKYAWAKAQHQTNRQETSAV